MKFLRTVSGLFALILLCSAAAYGCSCVFGGGAVCEDYWKASAVFVGTVIESKTVTVKHGEYYQQERLVRFSIDEPFRGAEGPQIEVTTGLGGGDCGIGFKQSQQYLVYASSFEGKLYTGICMRTKGISDAAVDLEYMRGLKKAKAGGVVYGEVTAYSRDDKGQRISRPITGARITIEGPEKTAITTDKKGEYRVPDLPTGDYTVVISPPQGLTTGKTEHKINLFGGGCAVVSFWLENDGRLSGHVVNPQGLPVNKAELFLIESGKERYQGHWDA
ncbi:MAG TPA: carboxypeptidase-like regulatory domain-containing protein, partial [Pyrinomonadaceae bacterium]|nr:carboxypeptidase-like regulatory domain-containing protein [Pyrinomonadaceae bacterium]